MDLKWNEASEMKMECLKDKSELENGQMKMKNEEREMIHIDCLLFEIIDCLLFIICIY